MLGPTNAPFPPMGGGVGQGVHMGGGRGRGGGAWHALVCPRPPHLMLAFQASCAHRRAILGRWGLVESKGHQGSWLKIFDALVFLAPLGGKEGGGKGWDP